MGNKVILYGASGHCKVIIDILENNNQEILEIIDDNPKDELILSKKIKKSSDFSFEASHQVILSIGNNKVRKRIASVLKVNFVKAIHPKAILSKFTSIGEGTVVMAGAIINPDVSIGEHCIINTGSVIEHDCILEDFVHISPNASLAGGVCVGEGTQIGIGATVIQSVKIGKWAVIGAGAVVIKDIPDFVTVVGNPGKIIKVNQ